MTKPLLPSVVGPSIVRQSRSAQSQCCTGKQRAFLRLRMMSRQWWYVNVHHFLALWMMTASWHSDVLLNSDIVRICCPGAHIWPSSQTGRGRSRHNAVTRRTDQAMPTA